MSIELKKHCASVTLIFLFAGLVACGEERSVQDAGTEDAGSGGAGGVTDVTPRSIGVDRFGCPMVDPTPWARAPEDYQRFCGDGCDPFRGYLSGPDEPRDLWFIACVSDEIMRGLVGEDRLTCAKGPVSDQGFIVNGSTFLALMDLCWYFCAEEGPDPAPFSGWPDYCFE